MDALQPLRALSLGALVPERRCAHAQATSWLHRIDHVHVREAVKRQGVKRYVVDVYRKRAQSHIPTGRPAVVATRQSSLRDLHAPDFTVERRMPEFAKLLAELYGLVEDGHGIQRTLRCAFCVSILDYVLQGQRVPGGVSKWLHSEASVCAQLTAYTNNLLKLVCRAPRFEDSSDCLAMRRAPELMKRFLGGGDIGSRVTGSEESGASPVGA